MDVTVYTTPTCPYCHHVKDFLTGLGVEFSEHDVSVDRAAADEMVGKSGQMGVPVTIIGDEVVVGFDHARLAQLLADRGDDKLPHFGLKVADASRLAAKMGMLPAFGAYVGKVAPASLGEKASLRPGDIITEVNLRSIRNADDLENALGGLGVGDRVMIVFLRARETMKSEIVI
jgi:glutaredoxin 3